MTANDNIDFGSYDIEEIKERVVMLEISIAGYREDNECSPNIRRKQILSEIHSLVSQIRVLMDTL